MLLGDMLAALGDETEAASTLMALGDLKLMVALDGAAHRAGETTASYAVRAVRRFADQADDDAWLDLMGALERADDPAAACLGRMLAWSLRRDGEPATRRCNHTAVSRGE
ncbi:MAG: hypothetical protein AB7F22_24025 [Reyranella sp.]|uniref:hypothetical protein n=1 Tax=Reyranella sp. TaxID=1929291 RepID=UPI003D0A7E59